ncbi:MAG: AAA family ATPase, partial [Candidatus Nealsonbacteria bacterium]|nr:AAA family ATPase [Candidatus Nealsonbacteria bacterium]
AGAGIADLRQVRDDFEGEAAKLFSPSPSASKPAINQILRMLKEAKKSIRAAGLSSTEWEQHDRELRKAQKRLAEVDTQLTKASREQTRLERIRDALPVIAKRKETHGELAQLGDVPILHAEFAEKRRKSSTELAVTQNEYDTAREAIREIDGSVESLDVPEVLAAHAEAIAKLPGNLGSYRTAQDDLPQLHADLAQFEKRAETVLREIRPDLTLDVVEQLRLTRQQKVAIQNQGNQHEALVGQAEQTQGEVGELEGQLADAEASFTEIVAPVDPAALEDAVSRTQARGDLEEQATAACEELQRLEQKADVDLERLGLWSGTLEECQKLAVPVPETVERFERELSDVDQSISGVEKELRQGETRRTESDQQIERLRLEGDVPTEDDLAEARRTRDSLWQAVLRAWQQEEADTAETAAFLAKFSPGLDLAAAYGQAVREADDLADRLRRESERVATKAGLEAERSRITQEIDALQQRADEAGEERQRAEQAWVQCWQPLGIRPLPPREMRSWAQNHRALVQQAEAIAVQRDEVGQYEDRIRSCRRELTQCLEGLAQPAPTDDETLIALLGRCRRTAEQIHSAADLRQQADKETVRLRQELGRARAEAEKAESKLAQWQQQWATTIEPLGLPADTSPAVANEVVAQIGELFTQLQSAEDRSERIDAINQNAERFRNEVRDLARQVDPELESIPVERAAEEMVERLQKAQSDRQKLEALDKQRKRRLDDRDKAQQTIDRATAHLTTLCQEAGCGDPDDLPQAERASDMRARLQENLQDLDDQLLRLGAGAAIESFIADAESVDADELPGQLDRLNDEIGELASEKTALSETIGGEKKALQAMDTSAAAAEAAEQAQSLAAQIEPDARQYIRLRLASVVLREGIERFRKKNEGPVLSRASDLFRTLTCRSFDGLQTDFDEKGDPVLVGVRPGEAPTVAPAGMSDGTADQLYLALRLAGLEIWLTRNDSLPFIVDDILIRFDDDRAVATLRVLADLSRSTQVVFFTHHAHLVELARKNLDPDVLFVQNLS